MAIKVQRVKYDTTQVTVSVLLARDGTVKLGASLGDYGSLDVTMAAPAPIATHVAAITSAVQDYLAKQVAAAAYAQQLETALSSVVVT